MFVSACQWPLESETDGRARQHNTRDRYTKNYVFTYNFGPPWGISEVTMTAVRGHLTSADFSEEYKNWDYPPPERLFDAPVKIDVALVRSLVPC